MIDDYQGSRHDLDDAVNRDVLDHEVLELADKSVIGVTASVVSDRCEVSPEWARQRLLALRHAGLLESRHYGQMVVYRRA
jgi:hypothetical protein